MMARRRADPWGRIGAVQPADLAEPTLQLHWAAQLVASAGQTFAEPRADDSHRAMSWNDRHAALVGAAFAGPYPFRVALRPRDLTLLILDRTDQTLGALPLRGRSRSEGYDWLSVAMATYLGGMPPHLERPEYDVPSHAVEHGRPFDAEEPSLAVLASLYGSAAEILAEIAEGRPDASAVRCWPHHFDIATLITLRPEGSGGQESDRRPAGGQEVPERGAAPSKGRPPRTIGVGLAPAGHGIPGWYWYVTPWPCPDAVALPTLAGPGSWHTEGWTGAVLPGAAVTERRGKGRRALVRAFLDEAIEAAERALGAEAGEH